MRKGEAFFSVAHDTSRPFFVTVGDVQVRVVGTKFDVKRGVDAVHIGVAEGVVEVRRPDGAAKEQEPQRLTAGQEVTLVPSVVA